MLRALFLYSFSTFAKRNEKKYEKDVDSHSQTNKRLRARWRWQKKVITFHEMTTTIALLGEKKVKQQ
jgi:hypothetical protein